MFITIRRACVAGLTMVAYGGVAMAAETAPTCGTEIAINGAGAIKEERAFTKAVDAWRAQAITTYGIYYGNEKFARTGTGVGEKVGLDRVRCGRTLVGLFVCQVRGRPCIENKIEQAGEPPLEICLYSPSPCDPMVKWVQKRLNEKGARIVEDGRDGDETRSAIRRYKDRRGLWPVDSNIDEPLLESLRV